MSRLSKISTRYHPYSQSTYSQETLIKGKVEKFYKKFLQSLEYEIKELHDISMDIPVSPSLAIMDIYISITRIEKLLKKIDNYKGNKFFKFKKFIERKITVIIEKNPSLNGYLDSSKSLDPLFTVEKKNLNILLNVLLDKILYILSLQDNVEDIKVLLYILIIYKLKELKSKISKSYTAIQKKTEDIVKALNFIDKNYGKVANIREFYISALRGAILEEQNIILRHYAIFLYNYLRYENEKNTGIPAHPQIYKSSDDLLGLYEAKVISSNPIDTLFEEQKTLMISVDESYKDIDKSIAYLTGGRRRNKSKRNMDTDMNMKDIKNLCKKNQIKLSKVVNDKRIVYKKKELITKLKRKKLI